jgi:hypothetical protein
VYKGLMVFQCNIISIIIYPGTRSDVPLRPPCSRYSSIAISYWTARRKARDTSTQWLQYERDMGASNRTMLCKIQHSYRDTTLVQSTYGLSLQSTLRSTGLDDFPAVKLLVLFSSLEARLEQLLGVRRACMLCCCCEVHSFNLE